VPSHGCGGACICERESGARWTHRPLRALPRRARRERAERSSGTRAALGGCRGAHSRRRAARQALAYRRRVLGALPAASGFQPLMTLYLTDRTPPDEVRRAREAGVVAFKLYPAGATTNSESGVTDIGRCLPTLRAIAQAGDPAARPCPCVERGLSHLLRQPRTLRMTTAAESPQRAAQRSGACGAQEGLLLLVHGEVTDPAVDFFDRERVFIETRLRPLLDSVPELRVVMEHITTRDAAEFVAAGPATLAASITPQHLLLNRNALFQARAAAPATGP